MNFLPLYLSVVFAVVSLLPAYAQVPSAQQASGQEALRQQQERDRQLREQLQGKKAVQSEEAPVMASEANPATVANDQKILIKSITVTGNTILSDAQIRKITAVNEGKEMTLPEMQKIADLLTDVYRKKGFITTRVILPPQQVANNTLSLQVVQGLMGNLEVRGNRFFRKSLFTKRVSIKKGEPFNYNKLRSDLDFINKFPDRNVKTVITPGQEPGQTDVVFNVKDRLPIHVGFAYDNFASRYIGKSRYTGTVTDNNLLGFDDILTFQYQAAEANAYRLTSFRYLAPLGKKTEIGLYSSQNQLSIGEEFKDLKSRGKGKSYGVFINQTLYDEGDLKVVSSAGFDYKDVFNFQLGSETSRDRLRVPKLGFTVDYADKFNGRNIFSDEISTGIPNFVGGLHAVDPRSSRVGAGGKFTKDTVDLLRLQQLPLDMVLLTKGQVQFASTILPASEQYQLGGISNVRGFAPGELSGDNGQSATAELTAPVYLIPKSLPVPFSKVKLYDALRLAAFYDWGGVQLRNPQAGESKARILDSLGCGLRLNLPESLSLRLDLAWPVTGRPSDGHNQHTWVSVSKDF